MSYIFQFIFDGKLSASVVIAYSPKNCDGQLCLHSASKIGAPYFVQVPHAIMKEVHIQFSNI